MSGLEKTCLSSSILADAGDRRCVDNYLAAVCVTNYSRATGFASEARRTELSLD
jgi:hypothetical protein